MIPLAVPNIAEREREFVLRAVESGYVSSVGPFVEEFERAFAEAVGARHAVACASGTAAIHVGLVVLGVELGDEVACSDFTFVGSSNPVRYLHGRLLLVDSDRTTWNLDAGLLADELTRRARAGQPLPKVVEVVHALGQPATIEPLIEVCDRYGIPVLEDAAESLGARWTGGQLSGRHTGTVGRVGAFSFNGNKIVTTGGGGMLVTDDADLAARAKHLTTQAKVPDVGYLHDEVGFNYRLTNVAAALGLAQLDRLPEFVERKRVIASTYDEALAGTGVALPPRLEGYFSTYWLYSVLLPDGAERDEVLDGLWAAGVGARSLWRPLHAQPPYAGNPTLRGEVADQLFARGISLPCSTNLTDQDQDKVIDSLKGLLK
jgi:dTDP-4-amino-4,6-dideoxygalactose transaminase